MTERSSNSRGYRALVKKFGIRRVALAASRCAGEDHGSDRLRDELRKIVKAEIAAGAPRSPAEAPSGKPVGGGA